MSKEWEPGHLISTEGGNPKVCPHCEAPPEKWELRNYNFGRHDGELYCTLCGGFVRRYDAG